VAPAKPDFVQDIPSEGGPRRDLRIALVEDESSLRTLLERTLSRAGYKIESATNGMDAIESFLHRAGDFDILVTDVVMPKLRGPALALKLRKANPELKVVFMSGYTDGALEGVELGSDPFLQKPFSPTEFLQALEKLSN
jgi:two-component system cell cycle sensor histidine kinase/response regulator CckA